MDNITYFHYDNAIMWVFFAAILIRMIFYCKKISFLSP